MTAALASVPQKAGPGRLSAEAAALQEQFPPRVVPPAWETTRAGRQAVLDRLLAPPFPLPAASGQRQRRRGLTRILDWLESQPGQTWQDRWTASGADTGGPADEDWRTGLVSWLKTTGEIAAGDMWAHKTLDVIRPGIRWLLTTTSPQNIAAEMARVRDPDGFAALRAAGQSAVIGEVTPRGALARIAFILAAKGGTVRSITVGDCIELMEASAAECTGEEAKAPTSTSCCTRPGCSRRAPRPPCAFSAACITDSSPRTSSSTGTTSPAGQSATCWRTTCANGSPHSTTTR
jgi:hypothetical protein